MKKITFLTLHLGYGGVENAVTTLSNGLSSDFDIEIVCAYQRYESPVLKLNKKISIKYLIDRPDIKLSKENFIDDVKNKIMRLKDRKAEDKLIKSFIRDCSSDIIISTNYRYNNFVCKFAKENIIKIGWEHNFHNNSKSYIKNVVKSANKLNYLIVVSKSLKDLYEENLKESTCKCLYIPNALFSIPSTISSLNTNNIITIGKLTKQKGYIELIEIFKNVSLKFPNWNLHIIGDGPERKKIEERIKKYKLEEIVIMHGSKPRKFIDKMLEQSSIYVMSSLQEGFGISLLEAFSFGIPCVAFNSALGASELISNNWDGYLINDLDKEKMAKKIIDLIKNDNRRTIMGDNARKKSLKYTIDIIKEEWLKILK